MFDFGLLHVFTHWSVDLYISIVLLAWSLARSDEIDLSAIAVKREILQFVIAYCSLDLDEIPATPGEGVPVTRLEWRNRCRAPPLPGTARSIYP